MIFASILALKTLPKNRAPSTFFRHFPQDTSKMPPSSPLYRLPPRVDIGSWGLILHFSKLFFDLTFIPSKLSQNPPTLFPKPCQNRYCLQVVPIIFSILFCIDFSLFFSWLQILRNPKNRAPVQAGALFLQNRRFGFESKIRSKNHRSLNPKIEEKLKKIVKKRCLKACCFLTSIFLDFGLHFASQVEV